MDWHDITDRSGRFEFIGLGTILASLYLPEDVQTLIDTLGVKDMVVIVNERHQRLYRRNAVAIVNHSGQLKVVQV